MQDRISAGFREPLLLWHRMKYDRVGLRLRQIHSLYDTNTGFKEGGGRQRDSLIY